MDCLVLLEISLGGEPAVAVRTLEGSLLGVRSHVDLQGRGTAEDLETHSAGGAATAQQKVGWSRSARSRLREEETQSGEVLSGGLG